MNIYYVGSNSGSKEVKDLPPELQQFDKALVERIEADIICGGGATSTSVLTTFDDIAGLNFAKKCVQEVVW